MCRALVQLSSRNAGPPLGLHHSPPPALSSVYSLLINQHLQLEACLNGKRRSVQLVHATCLKLADVVSNH
jgi:hypothetical protein